VIKIKILFKGVFDIVYLKIIYILF